MEEQIQICGENSIKKHVSKPKLEYIDYLRGFAILMIVAVHTIHFGRYLGPVWNTTDYVISGGTYLFVFIAGFLFQYLSYKFNFLTYLKKKFLNVIMPYWITMLPVALIFAFNCIDVNNFLYKYPPAVRFFEAMAFGEIISGPLWFIPMIVIFFLSAPALLWIREKKLLWYSLFLCSLLYTMSIVRPGVNITNVHHLLQYTLRYPEGYLKTYFFFFSAYAGGMIICDLIERYKDFVHKNARNIMWISLIAYIFCWWLFVVKLQYVINQYTTAKILTTIGMLAFFIDFQDKIKSIPVIDKTLKFFANYSFGIFFIHNYPLNIILHKLPYRTEHWYNGTGFLGFKAVGLALLYFVISLGFSVVTLYCTKWVLNKIGVKNPRMFIGVGNPQK